MGKAEIPSPLSKKELGDNETLQKCVEETLQNEQSIIYISFVGKISLFRCGRNSYATLFEF